MKQLIITPDQAAELANKELNAQQIRCALQFTQVPWGFAYKNTGGEFTYIISKDKFCNYFGIKEVKL
jgi:hypothetical protein